MSAPAILGVVLAGGLSRRMGRDKAGTILGGRTLLARVAQRLEAQCPAGVAVAAGPELAVGATGHPLLNDPVPGRPGPLAGLLAGLDFAHRIGAALVLTSAVDVPFLPPDLAHRLHAALASGAALACAQSGGRLHPVQALWPVTLRADLRRALADGERRVQAFADRRGCVGVVWGTDPFDPFHNVNTPGDLARAEAILATLGEDQTRPS